MAEYRAMRVLHAKPKAVDPVSTSYARMPIANTSAFRVMSGADFDGVKALFPGCLTTSGAMYSGVPAKPLRPPDSDLILTERLKSINLAMTCPSASNSIDTLFDFRSLCKMLLLCKNSSASSNYLITSIAWSSENYLP